MSLPGVATSLAGFLAFAEWHHLDEDEVQAAEFFQRQHVGLRQDASQPKIALAVAKPRKT